MLSAQPPAAGIITFYRAALRANGSMCVGQSIGFYHRRLGTPLKLTALTAGGEHGELICTRCDLENLLFFFQETIFQCLLNDCYSYQCLIRNLSNEKFDRATKCLKHMPYRKVFGNLSFKPFHDYLSIWGSLSVKRTMCVS